MRPNFHLPQNPGDPDWNAAYDDARDQVRAVDDFRAMARKDSDVDDPFPVRPALKATSPTKQINVAFRMNGKHRADNHFLFKSEYDKSGRSRPGVELPEDYQASRAARIGFIPLTLLHPKWVYTLSADAMRKAYVACVAAGEYFMVVVDEITLGEPKFEFVTAYELTQAELDRKVGSWRRIYPPAPPKKKK